MYFVILLLAYFIFQEINKINNLIYKYEPDEYSKNTRRYRKKYRIYNKSYFTNKKKKTNLIFTILMIVGLLLGMLNVSHLLESTYSYNDVLTNNYAKEFLEQYAKELTIENKQNINIVLFPFISEK